MSQILSSDNIVYIGLHAAVRFLEQKSLEKVALMTTNLMTINGFVVLGLCLLCHSYGRA